MPSTDFNTIPTHRLPLQVMEKQNQAYLPLLLSVMMAAGLLLGVRMRDAGPVVEVIQYHDTLRTTAVHGAVEEIIRYIEARYVDPMHRDSLISQAIGKVMGQLDPHSNYLTPAEMLQLNETREGQFSGIGIEFTVIEDTIYILRTIADSPAAKAGIRTGDRLIQIGGEIVTGEQAKPVLLSSLIRGKQGTPLRVKVFRPGSGMLDFQLYRATVTLASVSPGMMVDSTLGYIAIKRFGATTYREFMLELEQLVNEHQMQDLMIDLRGNPGGYLHEAVNILSQLFEDKNKLLVYTLGKNNDRNEYRTNGKPFFRVGQVIVLVDEYSASASEIVAGAIQDWDRGWVMGRPTFGKGLVQEQYPLTNGGAILLTVARYYTPSGRSIQRDYSDRTRYMAGKMNGDSAPALITDTVEYYTAGGRKVFGGGGIKPDVNIISDSIEATPLYKTWNPVIQKFIIASWENLHYKSEVEFPAEDWEAFLAWYENTYKGKKPKWDKEKDKAQAEKILRGLFAQEIARVFGTEKDQIAIRVRQDPEILHAVRIFRENPLPPK